MHLTEQELNEYLDNEMADRAVIKSHLDSCDECAARLSALQALFTDLDSLPEVALTRDIAVRFIPRPSLTAPKLPTWLTLTVSLQAVLALVALIVAIPFVSTVLPQIEMPPFTSWLFDLHSFWTTFLDRLSTFVLPSFQPLPIPAVEISSLLIVLAGVSILWILGNGLLLRNHNS